MTILGVDTGGTFTDFVLINKQGLTTHKVLSTPDAPERAILQGMQALGLSCEGLSIVHGSTVATNAVLERKGAATVFVTNDGLADMLTIGRQARPQLYSLQPPFIQPPVEADYCIETGGRLDAQGQVVSELSADDISAVCQAIARLAPRSVAINYIFSWQDSRFEQQLAEALPKDLFVSCSSSVLPRSGEYERGVATWLNAYVGPLVQGYLDRLQQATRPAKIAIMQSNGGTCDVKFAGEQAVNLLLSGPAGGLQAARYIGALTDSKRLLTFDMGGTSTDVAVIDGRIRLTDESRIADLPVAVPMVDMHTIGAGGGSIAWLDEAGVLQVGPESAGADPGPACYGQGGIHATVTDANVLLGHLPATAALGGDMQLDYTAAAAAIGKLSDRLKCDMEQVARGIVELANEHMVRALRVISVQRGLDPRDYRLASFGGAGGLHVCALADELEIRQALVPVHGGVLSALGMLVAPHSREQVQAVGRVLEHLDKSEVEDMLNQLCQAGKRALAAEGIPQSRIQVIQSLDLQYQGQSFVLNLPVKDFANLITDFHRAHEQRYGYALKEPVELVNLRVTVSGPEPAPVIPRHEGGSESVPMSHVQVSGVDQPVPLWGRNQLQPGRKIYGPAIIVESISTTWLAPGWECYADEWCNLLLEKNE